MLTTPLGESWAHHLCLRLTILYKKNSIESTSWTHDVSVGTPQYFILQEYLQ